MGSEIVEVEGAERLFMRVSGILTGARGRALQAVNHAMVAAYWEIGRAIVEEEQQGAERAEYGRGLITDLSRRLSRDFGKGFDRSNLMHMRAFYLAFPIVDAVRRQLTWTHYRLLLRIERPEARAFYEVEAVNAGWSTRELDRQINSLLFERLALSRDKAGVLALATEGHDVQSPADLVKDPYVLEFVGMREQSRMLESDLEQALTDGLQQFLLELGKGFAFMGRQQRITLDLKLGKLTAQDLGQMQMYVHYYEREVTTPDENPPIGIVLCADKNEAVVRYTLPEHNRQIFASRYKLYLPTEEELVREIADSRAALEMECALGREAN
jgi:predicted nuclease of restriction endonuclease-like (RecB) superfamily